MKTEQKCHYERSDSWTDLQFTEVTHHFETPVQLHFSATRQFGLLA
jgi:hypothetical protein